MIDAKLVKEKTKNLRVLYVEDDKILRHKSEILLKTLFLQVDVAVDGLDGLEKFNNGKYDLVISDIYMPNLDGIKMTEAIKEKNPEQIVIVTSAHDETKYLTKLIDARVDYFILKPMQIDKLMDVLDRASTRINTQKALEEKTSLLIQSSRLTAMGEMAGIIAHQWRQPLSSITLRLQTIKMLIEMDVLDKQQSIQDIVIVNDIVQDMSKIIDEFREFFRPNNDKSSFNILGVIDATIALLTKNCTIGIKIEKNFDDLEIYTYKSAFSQIIFQLLSNAIDAIETNQTIDGLIVLDIKKDNNILKLCVSDNGGGVHLDNINRIFEPYFSTKSKNLKGLGLYNIKLAIENYMDGNIEVFNENNGAKFVVTFPYKKEG